MKPSEVTASFPSVGSVTWNGRPQGWQKTAERPVFWLHWSPRTALAQPVLTVWAVPSTDRGAIRAWAELTAAPSMQAWLKALAAASETWRDREHGAVWEWENSGGLLDRKDRQGRVR